MHTYRSRAWCRPQGFRVYTPRVSFRVFRILGRVSRVEGLGLCRLFVGRDLGIFRSRLELLSYKCRRGAEEEATYACDGKTLMDADWDEEATLQADGVLQGFLCRLFLFMV